MLCEKEANVFLLIQQNLQVLLLQVDRGLNPENFSELRLLLIGLSPEN